MIAHYFSIETYSSKLEKIDFENDKIISICFVKFDLKTGDRLDSIKILKEWEESEEVIVKFIYRWFFLRNPWNFIPVGFNLNFEWKFLESKFRKYNLLKNNGEYFTLGDFFDIFPQLDLKNIAVIKKGEFMGTSLSYLTGNEYVVDDIHNSYKIGEYDNLGEYIENKAEDFLDIYKKIKDKL